jgi:hypothetical protein
MKYRHLPILLALLTAGAVLLLPACGPADADNRKANTAGEPAATVVDESVPGSGQQGGAIDGINTFLAELYAHASEQLDLTVEALTEALGTPPNLGVAAEKLGIDIEKLTEAMPQLNRGAGIGGGGGFGGGGINMFTEAAKKLDIAVDALVEAMGRPPNLEAAAEKLEIPIEKLREALPLLGEGGLGPRQ